MANYLPFNSIDHDRVCKAEDWAWYFSTFIGNGVFPKPTSGLMVMANGAMDVAVKAGFGFINGYAFRNQDDYVITISIGDGYLTRIDRVVLRWDLINRQIVLDVLEGTPSAKPQPVSLTRTADIYELALADITVTKGMTTVSQANITDRRTNTDLCGIVEGTVKQIDWSTLVAQLDAFMADYRQQVSDDYAAYVEDIEIYAAAFKQQSQGMYNTYIDDLRDYYNDITSQGQQKYDSFNTDITAYIEDLTNRGETSLVDLIQQLVDFRNTHETEFLEFIQEMKDILKEYPSGDFLLQMSQLKAQQEDMMEMLMSGMVYTKLITDEGNYIIDDKGVPILVGNPICTCNKA